MDRFFFITDNERIKNALLDLKIIEFNDGNDKTHQRKQIHSFITEDFCRGSPMLEYLKTNILYDKNTTIFIQWV
jgi:hypothetical protein